jgi:hypothetical protein
LVLKMTGTTDPRKEGLEKASDLLKLSVGFATGALVFSAGLIVEKLDLSGAAGYMLMGSWILLGISAAAGMLSLLAIPMMIAKSNYDLEDPYLEWPVRIHQVAFLFGIMLLGVALALALARGKRDPPIDPLPPIQDSKSVSGLGPELIGSVTNFALGSTDLNFESELVSRELGRVIDRWQAGRNSGKIGVLLVIGSADRTPLSLESRRRFDSNVGLANARAEAIKAQLLNRTKHLGEKRISEDAVLTLGSGPRLTPELPSKPVSTNRTEFPEDRRVDVWAVWGVPHVHVPMKPPTAK